MINKKFYEEANLLAEERNISVEDVYEIFRKSLVNSYKKMFGNTSCKVTMNPDKNEILFTYNEEMKGKVKSQTFIDIYDVVKERFISERLPFWAVSLCRRWSGIFRMSICCCRPKRNTRES